MGGQPTSRQCWLPDTRVWGQSPASCATLCERSPARGAGVVITTEAGITCACEEVSM